MFPLEFFCDSGHVIVFQGSALKSHPVVINPVRQFPTIPAGFSVSLGRRQLPQRLQGVPVGEKTRQDCGPCGIGLCSGVFFKV